MDGMRSTDTSLEPEVEVQPGLSPSRFVKVFIQGRVIGRKINLATHQNYASLSFTLKRLGNDYSSKFSHVNLGQSAHLVVNDSHGYFINQLQDLLPINH
jgi:auxin-responsive protein IAA